MLVVYLVYFDILAVLHFICILCFSFYTLCVFIFIYIGAVRFHIALFASEPEIVNKTTRVPRSSIHWTEILKQGKKEVQKHWDIP